MAIARKCDICGKFYEGYNLENDSQNVNGFMFLNICGPYSNEMHRHDAIDCCPECMRSIKQHIDNLRCCCEERNGKSWMNEVPVKKKEHTTCAEAIFYPNFGVYGCQIRKITNIKPEECAFCGLYKKGEPSTACHCEVREESEEKSND